MELDYNSELLSVTKMDRPTKNGERSGASRGKSTDGIGRRYDTFGKKMLREVRTRAMEMGNISFPNRVSSNVGLNRIAFARIRRYDGKEERTSGNGLKTGRRMGKKSENNYTNE